MNPSSRSPSIKKRNSLAMLIQDASTKSIYTNILPVSCGPSPVNIHRPTTSSSSHDHDLCLLATSAPVTQNATSLGPNHSSSSSTGATMKPLLPKPGDDNNSSDNSTSTTATPSSGVRNSIGNARSYYIIPSRCVNTSSNVVGGIEINRLMDQQQQQFANKRRRGVSTSELSVATSGGGGSYLSSSSSSKPASSHLKQSTTQTTLRCLSVSPDEVGGKMSSGPQTAFTPLTLVHSDPNAVREIQIKERQRKDSHNFVEQKRRTHINAQIATLENLLKSRLLEEMSDGRVSQGAILTKSVEYITEQHLMLEMRNTWNAMIPAITPLLDLIRSMEQRLSASGVTYPKRSEELLEHMRRLAFILNHPQTDDLQLPSTDNFSASFHEDAKESDLSVKLSPSQEFDLPTIETDLLDNLIPMDRFNSLDDTDTLQVMTNDEEVNYEAQFKRTFDTFLSENPPSVETERPEAMDFEYSDNWDISDLLDS